MKMSIRTRLFITVNLLIVFFVAFSWLMNSSYLEKYYVYQNKRELLSTSERIAQLYKGNVEDLALEIEKLERVSGLNILILNHNLEMKYHSRGIDIDKPPGPNSMPDDRAPRPDFRISLVSKHLSALQSGEQMVAVGQDPALQNGFLNVASMLNNGDYLLLSTPLVSLQESAAIANQFFLFTGLITIVLGCIAVYIFTRRFTRPILELNAIAQKMSELDFSQKFTAQTEDEVGELGDSINSLSDQLDKSISELQAANQKLLADIEHERRIDEMRKQFVSNVSHELKTPIALIQGYAEGLKVNVVEDEESKNYYCDVINDEAGKMNKMVRELLDLSQIEAGYFPLEKEVFEIGLLIEQVIAKYDLILKEEEILLLEEKADALLVNGDRSRIEQVLVNYLNNAMNHVDEHKQLRVKVHTIGDKVRIAVFNTGCPIPEESLDKIFTSFYKVDKARTRAYGGTGLGLSIVRALMELHQNDYGVLNVTGGVEFWFELDKIDPQ